MRSNVLGGHVEHGEKISNHIRKYALVVIMILISAIFASISLHFENSEILSISLDKYRLMAFLRSG